MYFTWHIITNVILKKRMIISADLIWPLGVQKKTTEEDFLLNRNHCFSLMYSHTHRLQVALRVSGMNLGRRLQEKKQIFRALGSSLAVRIMGFTAMMFNSFGRTHEWPLPHGISSVQMFLSVKCFRAGRNALSHFMKDGGSWDQPWHSIPPCFNPFSISRCGSLLELSYIELGFFLQNCTEN